MDTPSAPEHSPPYMSFETLKNFLSNLAAADLPPRIDRSIMLGMAGGAQTSTLSALREFGMVDGDDNAKTAVLDRFVEADPDSLADEFGHLVRSYYAAELELSATKATAAQLDELFEERYGYTGSTRRKAVTFFLHAAKFGKIPLSPHFKAARAAPSGKRGPRKTNGGNPAPPPPTAETPSFAKTVALPGATVTLSYTADLFELSTADREFILGMIDTLKNYGEKSAQSETQVVGDDEKDDAA